MEQKEIEYYDSFESRLTDSLLRLCTGLGMLDGTLLSSEDIDMKWKEFAPEYMADAVPQVNSFPEAAIGWAGYIGMAVAKMWDGDWGKHHSIKYPALYGKRGFDDMDDHITADILGLNLQSTDAGVISRLMLSCAQMTMDMIRHEHIEAQTEKAYHILARGMRAMFRIGEAVELKKLGYRFQKVEFKTPQGGGRMFS